MRIRALPNFWLIIDDTLCKMVNDWSTRPSNICALLCSIKYMCCMRMAVHGTPTQIVMDDHPYGAPKFQIKSAFSFGARRGSPSLHVSSCVMVTWQLHQRARFVTRLTHGGRRYSSAQCREMFGLYLLDLWWNK